LSDQWPEPDRALFGISVASELSGVHPQTLRLYEREGLIEPSRSAGGTRRYSPSEVERIREIAALTATGLNLVGVKRVLALQAEIRQFSKDLAGLPKLRAEARRLRSELAKASRKRQRDSHPGE
jgi:MerR family transcriptional regulator, heat shock protein HspR